MCLSTVCEAEPCTLGQQIRHTEAGEQILDYIGPPIGYADPLRPDQVEALQMLGLTLDRYGWLGALQIGLPLLVYLADRCRAILAEIRRVDGAVRVHNGGNGPASGYGYAFALHFGSTPACLGVGLFSGDGGGDKFLPDISSDLPDWTIRAALDTLDSSV